MSEISQAPPASHVPYVVAICVMALLGVVMVLGIQAMRPKDDNTALITMGIGFLATMTTSILALMKAQETHLSVNSRLDQFMKTAQAASLAEGILQGQSMTMQPRDNPTVPMEPTQKKG